MLLLLHVGSGALAQDDGARARDERKADREARREARRVEPDPTVRDIHFVELGLAPRFGALQPWVFGPAYYAQRASWTGGRGTTDAAIRTSMEQQESPFLDRVVLARHFTEGVPLDEDTLALDAYRVEIWYAHHGYFDARFIGWQIEEVRPAPRLNHLRPARFRRGPVVRVVGVVRPGPASHIQEVTIHGLDEVGSRVVQLRVEREAASVEGATFDLDTPDRVAKRIVRLLRAEGYALAEAEATILALPEEQKVVVDVTIDPGPVCSFGEVTVEGNVDVDTADILERVTLRPGQTYDPEELAATQSAIFSMGTFSVVQIVPETESGSAIIPIRIVVTESSFQEARVGGGFAFGAGAAEVHAPARYEHRNLGGRLIRLEMELEPGYKVFFFNADRTDLQDLESGPTLDAEMSLSWPNLFGTRRVSAQPRISGAQARELGYVYKALSVSPAFSIQVAPNMALSPSYRWTYTWDLNYTSELPDDVPYVPCEDLTQDCSYNLHVLQARFVWDTRSPLLQPTNGGYLEATLGNAGGPLPGFNFTRATVDLRRYQQFQTRNGKGRGVLAVRMAGGVARPYGDDEFLSQVPTPERFKLGGGTTVRGFAEDLLGPRTCTNEITGGVYNHTEPACRTPRPRTDLDITPNGGETILYGNVEMRIQVVSDVDVVLFSDIGGNWESWNGVQLGDLQPTAGIGVRYATVAGPIRLDFGYRLRDDPAYTVDRRYGVYFSIQEAF